MVLALKDGPNSNRLLYRKRITAATALVSRHIKTRPPAGTQNHRTFFSLAQTLHTCSLPALLHGSKTSAKHVIIMCSVSRLPLREGTPSATSWLVDRESPRRVLLPVFSRRSIVGWKSRHLSVGAAVAGTCVVLTPCSEFRWSRDVITAGHSKKRASIPLLVVHRCQLQANPCVLTRSQRVDSLHVTNPHPTGSLRMFVQPPLLLCVEKARPYLFSRLFKET